jgi:hypothetical protein
MNTTKYVFLTWFPVFSTVFCHVIVTVTAWCPVLSLCCCRFCLYFAHFMLLHVLKSVVTPYGRVCYKLEIFKIYISLHLVKAQLYLI